MAAGGTCWNVAWKDTLPPPPGARLTVFPVLEGR